MFSKMLGPLLGLNHWVPGPFPQFELKRPGRESAHLSLSSAEIKIWFGYKFLPTGGSYGVHGEKKIISCVV
jgi:hypothetical protein